MCAGHWNRALLSQNQFLSLPRDRELSLRSREYRTAPMLGVFSFGPSVEQDQFNAEWHTMVMCTL